MEMKRQTLQATAAGFAASAVVVLSVLVGSRGLKHFDPAVVLYAVGSMLAAFAVGYRFALWAQRPPSRLYFRRGVQLLLKPGSFARRKTVAEPPTIEAVDAAVLGFNAVRLPAPGTPLHAAGTLGAALASKFAAQTFIRRRSTFRWIMHLCLSGGCTLAFAITFPLVFGWIHFSAAPENAELYRVKLFGAAVDSFHTGSLKAWVMFNLLNISAVLVMIGLGMAAWRRMTDAGERATQKFFEDILPLLLIFAVTITGLMLTVSYKFLAGQGHGAVAIAHALSVVALLFYIPFGKLFHMFQRSCSLCVSLYQKAGANGPRAQCRRCGEDYASAMHVEDLKSVLDQLGFNYRFVTAESGEVHYQDICPACRRKFLAFTQGQSIGR
jgi:NNP family nitrate/nitrite transporter-like MFS transporter